MRAAALAGTEDAVRGTAAAVATPAVAVQLAGVAATSADANRKRQAHKGG